MHDIITNFLARPDAKKLLETLRERLAEETQRRQRFYEEITPSEKAEFILGEVIFHSPVIKAHNRVSIRITKLLDTYVQVRGAGMVGMEKLLIALTRNDYEPDICYFRPEKSKGFSPRQMRFPAPDLVVEVLSKSTEERDRGIKYEDYALHGVGEYWIVNPESETLEQYVLEGNTYRLHIKAQEGNIHVKSIEGLSFPIRACFDDLANVEALKSLLG